MFLLTVDLSYAKGKGRIIGHLGAENISTICLKSCFLRFTHSVWVSNIHQSKVKLISRINLLQYVSTELLNCCQNINFRTKWTPHKEENLLLRTFLCLLLMFSADSLAFLYGYPAGALRQAMETEEWPMTEQSRHANVQ